MASTKLKGKTKRKKARVERDQLSRKNQAFMPVIKKVTVEELKAQFKPAKKAAPKAEAASKAEAAVEEKPKAAKKPAAKKESAPKAEAKPAAKKKAAPKAKKEDK